MEDIHPKKTSEVSTPSVLEATTTPTKSPTAATTTATPAMSPTPNPTPASNHRQLFEDELDKDMDVLEAAAKEEQELYDALEQITNEVISQETESETRADIKEKLIRYQSIMMKKNHIIKSTQERVKSLELSLQHNCALSEEVVEEQKKELEVQSNPQ